LNSEIYRGYQPGEAIPDPYRRLLRRKFFISISQQFTER